MGLFDDHRLRVLLTRLTSERATNLDNLDALVSSRLAAASYTAPDNSGITAIKAKTDQFADPTRLDAAVSTRAPSSTAVSNADYTAARAAKIDNLDAAVSTRAAPGAEMDLSAAGKTSVRNALRDAAINAGGYVAGSLVDLILLIKAKTDTNLDATVSSRLATASYTAPDNAGIASLLDRLTAVRAGYLDNLNGLVASNLDALVSSRAPSATAVSNADYTAARAVLLDRLTAMGSGLSAAADASFSPSGTTFVSIIDRNASRLKYLRVENDTGGDIYVAISIDMTAFRYFRVATQKAAYFLAMPPATSEVAPTGREPVHLTGRTDVVPVGVGCDILAPSSLRVQVRPTVATGTVRYTYAIHGA